MKNKFWALLLFLLIGQVHLIQAENVAPSKNEMFTFLQNAFHAQLSLSERIYTKQEVSALLSPYFTDSYQQLFMDEHLFLERDGYILYGTDMPVYFIPRYSYDQNTVMIIKGNTMIIYEYFLPQLDGPLIWEEPHYESLTLIKTATGWKINDYNISPEKPTL